MTPADRAALRGLCEPSLLSPRPWRIAAGISRRVVDARGNYVCETDSTIDAGAIVAMANAAPALLDAADARDRLAEECARLRKLVWCAHRVCHFADVPPAATAAYLRAHGWTFVTNRWECDRRCGQLHAFHESLPECDPPVLMGIVASHERREDWEVLASLLPERGPWDDATTGGE